jgi:transcriptional regulator with XRE-family HTH domain
LSGATLGGGARLRGMAMQTTHQATVGTALRARREALKLSREALGAAAGGVSSSTIRRVELGTVRPHPSTISALAQALEAADAACGSAAVPSAPQRYATGQPLP